MSESTSFLKIDTPENVVFGYEVAGLGLRFFAACIDTLIIAAMLLVTFMGLGFAGNLFDLANLNPGWIAAALIAVMFIIVFGYYIVFEIIWNGQSPGKRVFHLRVIQANGLPVTVAGSLIRSLVRLMDFVPVLYGAGVISMFLSHKSRRLGDIAANTLVVYEKKVTLESLAAQSQSTLSMLQFGGTFATGDLPLNRLSSEDIQLAENFLQRHDKLTNSAGLIRPILQQLYDRMELPLEDKLRYSDAMDRLGRIILATRAEKT